jgi:hypothetical protein
MPLAFIPCISFDLQLSGYLQTYLYRIESKDEAPHFFFGFWGAFLEGALDDTATFFLLAAATFASTLLIAFLFAGLFPPTAAGLLAFFTGFYAAFAALFLAGAATLGLAEEEVGLDPVFFTDFADFFLLSFFSGDFAFLSSLVASYLADLSSAFLAAL